jgi:two-component system cell cycle response regulator
MIDIDHFKQTNDTYGHLAGDEALKVVSSIIKGYFKNYGLCCRYGGEEFAIALLEACYDKAHEYAEKLRILVEEANISFGGQIIPLTISIGLAIKDEQETIKKEDLILRADKALYRAKHNGRNQTVLYKELEE